MVKRILLYYPPNKRSVAIETMCRAAKEAGNELIMLTLSERGPLHEVMEQMGIRSYSSVFPRKPSWKYFINQTRFLISFCKEHNIDAVWAHLQEANIIALFGRRFIKAKIITFRHHAESAFYAEYGPQFNLERNKNEARTDKLLNKFASTIVVPSSGVWYGMEKYEGCDMKKVKLVPYIYDFSTYGKPNADYVRKFRADHPCRLMLIMVSRLISTKQHMPVFEVVNQLIKEGLSIKMIVMDDGALRPQLEEFIRDHQLEQDILMVGYQSNFVDFMAVSDLLVHPSLTEASNNVVKEMGILSKAVAVCEGVGDFDDYIQDGENGYILKRGDLKAGIEKAVRDAYDHPHKLNAMGERLRQDVIRLFSDTKENRERFLQLI